MFRVSVIGARRCRNGIGEYIAKYFHRHEAHVISVLGTTEESSQLASRGLRKYGIEAIPYTRFDAMVDQERPDAVVIASPYETHHAYLAKSIDSGLHVFCEKPLTWPVSDRPGETVGELLKRARGNGVTVAMNTQLPLAMGDYERLCGRVGPEKVSRLFVRLSPAFSGKEMIPDSVPHALSLLYFTLGEGTLSDLVFQWKTPEEMSIRFNYLSKHSGCEVCLELIRKEEQPREFRFGFNNRIVKRTLDLATYDLYFEYGEKRIKVADPLEKSVLSFIEAAEEREEPFMGYGHILNNMALLKMIYDGCPTESKERPWRS